MAVNIEQLTMSPYVYSPFNLNSFLKWCATATEDDIDQVMEVVYIVEHRYPDELFGPEGTPPIVIDRDDLGIQWMVPRTLCEDEDCHRCNSGRSGWQFRWIGPWTCPMIIGDENTPVRDVVARTLQCTCGRH